MFTCLCSYFYMYVFMCENKDDDDDVADGRLVHAFLRPTPDPAVDRV